MANAILQQEHSSLATDGSGVLMYKVTGLQTDGGTGVSRLNRALAAAPKAPPSRQSEFTRKIISQVHSEDAVTVAVEFKSKDATGAVTMRMGTITEIVDTSRDINGEPMTIKYSRTMPGASEGEPGDGAISTTGKTTMFVPRTTLIIRHRTFNPPVDLGPQFVGAINKGAWISRLSVRLGNVDIPHRWLCIGIEVLDFAALTLNQMPQDQQPFDVQYTFAYNPKTWHRAVAIDDPETAVSHFNIGKIKSPQNQNNNGMVPGKQANGIRVFQVQGEKDFSVLPFISSAINGLRLRRSCISTPSNPANH